MKKSKELEENATPASIGGMGATLLPTATQPGSGDVPAGTGDAEEEYKKKKKKMKHIKAFESFKGDTTEVNESMSSFYFTSPSDFDAFSNDAPAKGETKYLVMANNRANFNGQEIRLEGTVRFGSTSKKQIIGIFNDEESATEAYKKAMKKPEGTFVSFTMGTLVGETKFRSQYTEIQGYLATAKVK